MQPVRRLALRRGAWAVWAGLSWALCACTLLVQSPEKPLSCAVHDDEDDPCPEGLQCIDGECEKPSQLTPDPCADGPNDEPEICNGIDDNCNGDIDEGHDKDEDGVTWCFMGLPETGDCDDFDRNTHPGAPELCDGRDNDCDGEIDEAPPRGTLCKEAGMACLEQRCVVPNCLHEGTPVVCEDGTRCAPSGECVRGDGCDQDSCQADEVCDEASGTCVGRAKPNGVPCSRHEECSSGNCTDTAALRMTLDVERVCGESCCSDVDCPEGEFCFASGTGARSCLPVGWDPRPDDTEVVCSVDDVCDDDLTCVLKDGQEVRGDNFARRDDLASTVCSMPEGSALPGSLCRSDASCASGICEPSVLSYCSLPCGRTAECAEVESFNSRTYCRTKAHGGLFRAGVDFVSVCVETPNGQGGARQGEPCEASSECADAACVRNTRDEPGYCASACCSDIDCIEGTACRALAFGDHYEMRCAP